MIPTKGKLLRERPLVEENASALEKSFIVYASSKKELASVGQGSVHNSKLRSSLRHRICDLLEQVCFSEQSQCSA